jgi:hypothetical protein
MPCFWGLCTDLERWTPRENSPAGLSAAEKQSAEKELRLQAAFLLKMHKSRPLAANGLPG